MQHLVNVPSTNVYCIFLLSQSDTNTLYDGVTDTSKSCDNDSDYDTSSSRALAALFHTPKADDNANAEV